MKSWVFWGIAVLIAVWLVGCVSFGYYFNEYMGVNFEKLISELCIIETKAVFENNQKTEEEEQLAVGIPIDKNLVVSLTHATEINEVETVSTPFGRMALFRGKKISEKHRIRGGSKLKLVYREKDISIFKGSVKHIFSAPIGDDGQLKAGDKVVIIGRSFMKMFNIKDGIVSNTDSEEIAKEYKLVDKCILISAPVNPGDSGSPLLAIRQDGKLELVGIVNAAIQDKGMGFAIRISEVVNGLKKIK